MIELQCHSYYSFLAGVSSPEALAERAAQLGMRALALTDRNGLYGAPAFYRACKAEGVQPIIGAQLTIAGGDEIVLLCRDGMGYANLSQLITASYREKGVAEATLTQLAAHRHGLLCLVGCKEGKLWRSLAWRDVAPYEAIFGADCYLALTFHDEEQERRRCGELAALGLPLVITGAPRYATPAEASTYDLLCAIAQRKPLRDALRPPNHQRYVGRPLPTDFADCSAAIAAQCSLDLDFSSYRFPKYEGDHALRDLCESALEKRYRTSEARKRLEEELALIERLDLTGYFLIVWDLVRYARSRNIPVQGRGSAANSLVAYLLGITPVDPIAQKLFLGRFLHDGMTAIPDIDLDFAATRGAEDADREDVIQYIYDKYGRDRVAMVCTFVTFRRRSAIREVGMALEVPQKEIDKMAKLGVEHGTQGPLFAELTEALQGIPRHLSIHVGGMVIASKPISHLVPLEPARMEGRSVCQWDKDLVDDAGLIKVDILGLGMLAVLRDACAFASVEEIPEDDPDVYRMIGEGDTVGLFQIESRAQMQSLPRTRPTNLAELGVQVAIIRPGPLQGNMVSPYIRRRQGLEPVTYPHPCLEPILKETLGVILFQEQVLQVAVAMAGFTSAQADALRKAMGRKRSKQAMAELEAQFLAGAASRSIDRETASQTFELLRGFALYGFCKSHALAFATLTYRSAWLKLHHPAAFTTALLRNQPMGFYSPEVLLEDAKRRGVRILPVDVNASLPRASLEEGAIRLGLLSAIGPGQAQKLLLHRPYTATNELPLDEATIEILIQAGACDSLHTSRRGALFQLWARPKPFGQPRDTPTLPSQSRWEKLLDQYATMGFATDAHPLAFLRQDLTEQGVITARSLPILPDGRTAHLAGLQVCRQKPPTARGFAFLTLEDETGLINIVVPPPIYERYKVPIKLGGLLSVVGHKQGINVRAVAISGLRPEPRQGSSPCPGRAMGGQPLA